MLRSHKIALVSSKKRIYDNMKTVITAGDRIAAISASFDYPHPIINSHQLLEKKKTTTKENNSDTSLMNEWEASPLELTRANLRFPYIMRGEAFRGRFLRQDPSRKGGPMMFLLPGPR